MTAPLMTRDFSRCHFSSRTVEWYTPPDFFAKLDAEFGFTLDVAATPENAKCARFFTEESDGLAQDWSGDVCWMNPPYGRTIARWMRKAYEESRRGGAMSKSSERRIRRGESRPVEQRTRPGGGVNTTAHAWGEAAGQHLLERPPVPPLRLSGPYWTQAERDRWQIDGILPEQASLFDPAGEP